MFKRVDFIPKKAGKSTLYKVQAKLQELEVSGYSKVEVDTSDWKCVSSAQSSLKRSIATMGYNWDVVSRHGKVYIDTKR